MLDTRSELAVILSAILLCAPAFGRAMQGEGPGPEPSFSADGRFLAFASPAANLVPGDTNGFADVFVHDRETAAMSLVSVAADGRPGNGDSCDPWLSADGRFVAFWSFASNLDLGDVNGLPDVFVHDRWSGVTRLVSEEMLRVLGWDETFDLGEIRTVHPDARGSWTERQGDVASQASVLPPPGTFLLTQPVDTGTPSGSSVIPIRLRWTASSDQNSYLVELADDATFTPVAFSYPVSGIETGHDVPAAKLQYGHVYYWRVQAINASGATTASNAPFQFSMIDPAIGGDGSDSMVFCFVATAAYGSPMEPEVRTLRAFRDRVLMPTAPGRALVSWYYRHSPPLAAAIAERPAWRKTARVLLWPVVGLADVVLWADEHPLAAVGIACAVLALAWLSLRHVRARWRSRSHRRPGLAGRLSGASLLATALVASCWSCGPIPGEEKIGRGVLVVVVGALRADHVSAYGYDRKTTPFLDALAAEGVLFSSAYTAAPEDMAAHAAILSGCDPMLARRVPIDAPSRGTPVTDWYLPDELPRLPRAFLSNGYATAAFVDHPAISPVCGFGAGFQAFRGYEMDLATEEIETGYEGVSQRFLNWISGLDLSQDWFAYVQLGDLERLWLRPDQKWDTFFEPRPELTTVPPIAVDERVFFALARARWDGGSRSIGQLEARYDGALRSLDQNLGRFFDKVRRIGRWEATTIVVLGSHGVGFGESGVIADTGTFSDCDLRVPLIVRPAAGLPAVRGHRNGQVPEHPRGVSSSALASLVDLAPALLQLHGIAPPRGMREITWADMVEGGNGNARELAFAAGGMQAGFAVIDARFCYEESSPGGLEQEAVSPLSRTWYGDDLDHRRDVRRYLHDRAADRRSGHLGASAEDAEAIARLSAAGREHYEWIEKARAVLQASPEERGRFDASLVEELDRRGLLGEGPLER